MEDRRRETSTKTRPVRQFETGANRDTDEGKLDYDGFLSPYALEAYAEYMHKNRFLSDGTYRDSDNWTKGIPQDVYRKSLLRHALSAWKWHRHPDAPSHLGAGARLADALCGVIFNAMGLLHELTRPQEFGPTVAEVAGSLSTDLYEITPAGKAALEEARSGWRDTRTGNGFQEIEDDRPLPRQPQIFRTRQEDAGFLASRPAAVDDLDF